MFTLKATCERVIPMEIEKMTQDQALLWRKTHRLLSAQHHLALIDEGYLASECEFKAHALWRNSGNEDLPTWVLGQWAEEVFNGLETGKIVTTP